MKEEKEVEKIRMDGWVGNKLAMKKSTDYFKMIFVLANYMHKHSVKIKLKIRGEQRKRRKRRRTREEREEGQEKKENKRKRRKRTRKR